MNDHDFEVSLRKARSNAAWDTPPPSDMLDRVHDARRRRRVWHGAGMVGGVVGCASIAVASALVAMHHGGGNPAEPAPAASLSASPGVVTPCLPTELTITRSPDVSFSAQWSQTSFEVKNSGTSTCSVQGYPAIAAFTSAGVPIPITVKQSADFPNLEGIATSPISLAPAAAAKFLFAVVPEDCSARVPAVLKGGIDSLGATLVVIDSDANFCPGGQTVYVSPLLPVS